MALLLLPLGFAVPWIAGIAWVAVKGGPGTLVPHDEVPPSAKWVVCRECNGTGRTDKKGRKRLRPDEDG